MSAAGSKAVKAGYSALIYLRGADKGDLDDAELRCREYAHRFGWPVRESIRASDGNVNPGYLIAKVSEHGAQIILTDTLDMISPDQSARDDVMMAIERAECIVHPVSTPSSP